MTSWAIVALPREDDPVWQLSSEKVPHMTLLFLGEQSEPAMAVRITEYLQHAVATSLAPFGMSVERRGELGPDQADVLFFEEEYAKKLNDFRGFLLKNDDIAAAHASTFQYPQWTPHLTMGYPESPSKKLPPGQMGRGWVSFDRIAFWIEDYDGPEFILPRHSDMVAESSMAMSSEMDDFLAHHGVKGMKWGQRRTDAQLAKANSLRRVGKGGGNLDDHATAVRTLSVASRARNGFEGAATKKANKIEGKIAAKGVKTEQKGVRKAERQKILNKLDGEFNLSTPAGRTRTGATAVATIVAGPAANLYLGAKIAQSAGYTKGQSYAASAILGGAPGAIVLAELSVRSKANR